MKGILIKFLGQEYKVGLPDTEVSVICTLVLERDEFILGGGGISSSFIGSWQKIRDGIEFEVEVAEFEEATEPISESNPSVIDPEYQKMIDARDEEWELNWKLHQFRKIEAILQEEGLI